MAPIIQVSDKVLEHLNGLGVFYETVEQRNEVHEPETTREEEFRFNKQDYIILEGKSGKEGYPDLHVAKYRLSAEIPGVKSAGRRLGLDLADTAKEKNGRGYLGNINREQALNLNLALGGRNINTRIFRDFLALLLSGKAFNAAGKKIDSKELETIAEEIIGVRSPWRSEWFEDYFTANESGILTLNKNYSLDGDDLNPGYSHKLTTCLMQDKTPGINLQYWMKNSTAQGFLRKNTKQGNLYYWHPRQNSAVRFFADGGGASLYCDGYPDDVSPWLGSRHLREAQTPRK